MRIGTMLTAFALALAALCLPACEGAQRYRLLFDGYGFESERMEYAAGEKVTVTYDLIGMDTDYTFTIDEDVTWERDFDNLHGYVFRFTMPAHDVMISVESHSSMTMDPDANQIPDALTQEALLAGIDEEYRVFRWYRSTAGSVGGDHSEYVLYARPEGSFDGGLLLAQRVRTGSGPLRERACVVPERVLDECLEAVDSSGMKEWKDGAPIFGGATYAVEWREEGVTARVSSDVMPADGERAFGEIAGILGDAWTRYALPEGSVPEPGWEGLREGEWFCPDCGMKNGGKYCAECGRKAPEPFPDEG